MRISKDKKTGENGAGENKEELLHGWKNVTMTELAVSHDQTGTRRVLTSPGPLWDLITRKVLIPSDADCHPDR